MEPPKYIRKFEQLERSYLRIKRLYDGKIINQLDDGEGEDSFHSPKDIVRNFFQLCYELKESLKFDPSSSSALSSNVEHFCNSNILISLSLDIANQEKHVVLSKPKTNKVIGEINTAIHILSPLGPSNRTELTIEIDGKKEDCFRLAGDILDSWKKFYSDNNLL